MRLIKIGVLLLAVLIIEGCASGVTRQGDATKPHRLAAGQTVKPATLEVTPGVKASLDDNIKFNPGLLLGMVNRRLEVNDLTAPNASLSVNVIIKDVRVRSTAAAVLFGFMAGEDRIVGDIHLTDASGRMLDRFEISASYALGGFAGGQDGMRLDWLYEEFSKLLVGELKGTPDNAKK